MAIGETLLKFTDYPFAYSIIFIIAGIAGFGISQNKIYLLGIAGAFGTLLTITDPIGLLVKEQLKARLEKSKKDPKINKKYSEYHDSAIQSRAIGIEIDRIGAMLYFVFTAFVFLVGILIPGSLLTENFIIHDNDNRVICNEQCIQIYSIIGCFVIFGVLSVIAKNKWTELDDRVSITRLHQFVIGNENATVNSVENLTRAIDLGDWSSAAKWGTKIEDEIKNKKGKREQIIKSADTVFSPLHTESVSIENQINQFESNRIYSQLIRNEWNAIVSKSYNFMIVDTDLRQRIHNLYKKIDDYNSLAPIVTRGISEMVNSVMSSTYQKRLTEIFVNVKTGNASTGYPMMDCALFNVHPTTLQQGSVIQSISAQQVEDNGNRHGEGFGSIEDIKKFEEAWQIIIKNISSDEKLSKLKQLINEIKIENHKLQEKYHEMIEWQWKV